MKSFEKYLEEQCDYEGVLDDDYEDCLDNFITGLDIQEVIDYAETWGMLMADKARKDMVQAIKDLK